MKKTARPDDTGKNEGKVVSVYKVDVPSAQRPCLYNDMSEIKSLKLNAKLLQAN